MITVSLWWIIFVRITLEAAFPILCYKDCMGLAIMTRIAESKLGGAKVSVGFNNPSSG
jgi:hypothetical protein